METTTNHDADGCIRCGGDMANDDAAYVQGRGWVCTKCVAAMLDAEKE